MSFGSSPVLPFTASRFTTPLVLPSKETANAEENGFKKGKNKTKSKKNETLSKQEVLQGSKTEPHVSAIEENEKICEMCF